LGDDLVKKARLPGALTDADKAALKAVEDAKPGPTCIGRAGIRGRCGVTGCPKCDPEHAKPSES
jgi:hypothetical protein